MTSLSIYRICLNILSNIWIHMYVFLSMHVHIEIKRSLQIISWHMVCLKWKYAGTYICIYTLDKEFRK